jgi:predicted amidohydrolase YtcJ
MLKIYIINAQHLIKNDNRKGLLLQGYLANIAVFEEDIFIVAQQKQAGWKVIAILRMERSRRGAVKSQRMEWGSGTRK